MNINNIVCAVRKQDEKEINHITKIKKTNMHSIRLCYLFLRRQFKCAFFHSHVFVVCGECVCMYVSCVVCAYVIETMVYVHMYPSSFSVSSHSFFFFHSFICRESLSPTLRIRIDFGGIHTHTYTMDSKSDYSLLLPLPLYKMFFVSLSYILSLSFSQLTLTLSLTHGLARLFLNTVWNAALFPLVSIILLLAAAAATTCCQNILSYTVYREISLVECLLLFVFYKVACVCMYCGSSNVVVLSSLSFLQCFHRVSPGKLTGIRTCLDVCYWSIL